MYTRLDKARAGILFVIYTINTNMATKKKSAAKKKNSLVNNINARKKKGKSRSKKRSTISNESYAEMENNWGEKK